MPETQKIAFISSLMLGGSTTFLSNIGGELARRKIPAIVISPEKENAFPTDFETAGVKVVLHDDHRLIFEDRMQALLQTLAEFKPTIVVGCLGEITYEVLRYVPQGIRRIAVVQADAPIFYNAIRPFAGYMDDVVGVSNTIVKRFENMEALRAVSKHYLPYGVAMPKHFQAREKTEQPLRILYFGRIINEQKRVHLFPDILAGLKKAGIPFRWTIAGDGNQRANLERLMASDNPSQQVVFPGPLPNADVPHLLENHDVFLLASNAEGLPLSLLEAMGHGLVPVVSDLESGIPEVVDASNGMLVPVDDVNGYARAIIHLHEHREELAAKSAAAQARVQAGFSTTAMTDRWLAAFPPTAQPIAEWPRTFDIQAPLTDRRKLFYSKPVRVLRRLVKKWRR